MAVDDTEVAGGVGVLVLRGDPSIRKPKGIAFIASGTPVLVMLAPLLDMPVEVVEWSVLPAVAVLDGTPEDKLAS